MKRMSDSLQFRVEQGHLVAVLGNDAVAKASGQLMQGMFAGMTMTQDNGDVIYFNGACDENGYRDLYDRAHDAAARR